MWGRGKEVTAEGLESPRALPGGKVKCSKCSKDGHAITLSLNVSRVFDL